MPGCRVGQVTRAGPEMIRVIAHGRRSSGRCPDCGRVSAAVHSTYRRHPADLRPKEPPRNLWQRLTGRA